MIFIFVTVYFFKYFYIYYLTQSLANLSWVLFGDIFLGKTLSIFHIRKLKLHDILKIRHGE